MKLQVGRVKDSRLFSSLNDCHLRHRVGSSVVVGLVCACVSVRGEYERRGLCSQVARPDCTKKPVPRRGLRINVNGSLGDNLFILHK